MAIIEELARIDFDAAELIQRFPPHFHNANKRMLLDMDLRPPTGRLQVSRWRGELSSLIELTRRPRFEMSEDAFSYPPSEPGTVPWHLNFADRELFGYYGGPLLAQDEHQVLEHPALASLREALLDLQANKPELAPRTRASEPTPYLIVGVQRRLAFDTLHGLYGNAFANAARERIIAAARTIEPPTFSNILAMVAPAGGSGPYSVDEISDILRSAYVGFGALKAESAPALAVVHTGNWGCGAYGGNPVLMALLQLIAAEMAGLDRLVYHTFSARFSESYREARDLLEDLVPVRSAVATRALTGTIDSLGFEWGQPNGT